jgi:hypothetical protein
MVAKGRNYVPPPMPGEQNPRARITAQQAAVIRSDPRSGPKIAAHYGIGTSTVYHIKNGDTWKDN